MKKLVLLNLLFFAILPACGQIAVESFRLLETDLTANVQGTMEIDQNGEVAALIKVVTTQQGFTFDNGMLGIVKVVSQPGEFWVYVPRKTQKITISHPDLGILRDYYFQIPIEGARTYELKLTTGQVITTVKKARTTQYLTIRVTPPNATLYVDDELQPLSSNGTFFKLVSLGRHTYRLQAAGYKGTAGVVEVNASEKADVSVELLSLEGTLSIECADKEADIVVNEEIKGHGSWKGNLFPGMYIVEARRSNHKTITEEITLGELEKKTVTLSSPIPILGSLRVESDPMGATVFIDGKRMDDTPCVLDESVGLLIGSHEVKLSKEGYALYTASVTLKEDEETILSGICLEQASDHEYVDLGLPSGTLWATCNVGASKPEDYGDYFAWGETTPKSDYRWNTYKWCNGKYDKLTKYNTKSRYGAVDNKKVLEMPDDAALQNWGGSWRMPTDSEWSELRYKCTWSWTSQGGRNGYKVTSKSNGNSIFLPAAGYRDDAYLGNEDSYGYYWSSSLRVGDPNLAWFLFFNSGNVDSYGDGRCYGHSVRPVRRP